MLGFSPLDLYWVIHIGLFLLFLIGYFTIGLYYDKSHGDRDPDDPVKFYQFRKRMAMCYFFGLMFTIWLLWHVLWTCFGWPTGERYDGMIAYFVGTARNTTEPWAAMLALLLYDIHMCRRYYESLSVSILTLRQPLNPLWALDNFLLPIATALSIVAQAPFSAGDASCFTLSALLNLRTISAVPLYLWASKLQHQSLARLSKLRTNRAGHVVTSAYKIPKGEWFDSVSCPHYFAEILIHVSLGILLWTNATTWSLVTCYVLISQVYLASSTHKMYTQKFPDYPSDKKIIVPFVY